MTKLQRPVILVDGKKQLYREEFGFLLGGLNFSFKRITGNKTLTIPQNQQMIVMEDLQVDSGSDIVVGVDSDVYILSGEK